MKRRSQANDQIARAASAVLSSVAEFASQDVFQRLPITRLRCDYEAVLAGNGDAINVPIARRNAPLGNARAVLKHCEATEFLPDITDPALVSRRHLAREYSAHAAAALADLIASAIMKHARTGNAVGLFTRRPPPFTLPYYVPAGIDLAQYSEGPSFGMAVALLYDPITRRAWITLHVLFGVCVMGAFDEIPGQCVVGDEPKAQLGNQERRAPGKT